MFRKDVFLGTRIPIITFEQATTEKESKIPLNLRVVELRMVGIGVFLELFMEF